MTAGFDQFPDGHAARIGAGRGLYAHIVETLGREIVSGAAPAGQILQAEQLSERFGISRSVVRESVRTLSSMGLLEARPQVGTRVLPIANWDLLNPQIIRWRGLGPEASQQQRELLELRLGVEPTAARFAATRMRSSSTAELVNAAAAMRRALDRNDGYAFFDADSRFHRLLLEGSENLLISKFADAIDAGLHMRTTLASTELNPRAVELHVALADALLAQDADRAERLATQIIEQTLAEFVPEPNSTPPLAAGAH